MNIAERAAAKQACSSMAFVCEASSEATRAACKAAITALCDEFQIVQFGLLANGGQRDQGYVMSLPDAVKLAKKWAVLAENELEIGEPVSSPDPVVKALTYFAKEQWRHR